MGIEIERKFLIDLSLIGDMGTGIKIQQGYLPTVNNIVVRARVSGHVAYLTLKGKMIGISRTEFEYEIPVSDAQSIIDEMCNGLTVDKTRYMIPHCGHVWEIDIFHGDNDGLIVAEVEMNAEDEIVELPVWVVKEVTDQRKYSNSSLLDYPFKLWEKT